MKILHSCFLKKVSQFNSTLRHKKQKEKKKVVYLHVLNHTFVHLLTKKTTIV